MLSLLFATSAHHVRKTSLSSRCRGLHTTSVFQLQRHDVNDDGPTLPDLPGGPRRQRERPSGSIFDYFLRSAREARERKRDRIPAFHDSPNIRKVYDLDIRGLVYTTQVLSNIAGFSAVAFTLAYVNTNFLGESIQFVKFMEVDTANFKVLLFMLITHATALWFCTYRSVLRIYFDMETNIYKIVFCHPIMPLRTQVIEIPQHSCTKIESSETNTTPWKNCVFKIEPNGRKMFLFNRLFISPHYFNGLLKIYKY